MKLIWRTPPTKPGTQNPVDNMKKQASILLYYFYNLATQDRLPVSILRGVYRILKGGFPNGGGGGGGSGGMSPLENFEIWML